MNIKNTEENKSIVLDENNLISRAFRHEAFKKGIAAAAAGVLFAVASEVLFPTDEP
jgi:hypothetical protein